MAWLRRDLFWPNQQWTNIHASFRHGSLQKCLYSTKQRKVMKQPFHPPWLEQRTTQSLHGKAERKKPSLDYTLHSFSLEKTTQQFNPTESGKNSKDLILSLLSNMSFHSSNLTTQFCLRMTNGRRAHPRRCRQMSPHREGLYFARLQKLRHVLSALTTYRKSSSESAI